MKKAMSFLSFFVLSATTLSHPSIITSQKDVEAVCKTIR
jgi:hypothetical protein